MFLAGAWGLIAAATLHTLGNFEVITGASNNPKTQPAVVAMAAVVFEGLGMRFSLIDIFRSFNASFGWLLAMVGVLDLVGLRLAADQSRAISCLGGTSMVGVGVLVMMFSWFQIPPPLITLATVWLLFGFAILVNARSQRQRD